MQKFKQFKKHFLVNLKNSIIDNQYLCLSMGAGMVVLRSIVFGSSLGGISYVLGKNISKRLSVSKDMAIIKN
jgi:hypothetical protein